jgi:hypothetical protein
VLHEGLQGVEGRLDERGDGLVEAADGHGDGRPVHLQGGEPGLGVQRLLGDAGGVEQALPADPPEPLAGRAADLRRASGEHGVEVVPAQAVVAVGGENFVALAVHGDEGGVEGTAAQVVDEDARPAGVEGLGVAVRVLEAGGRRLIEHRRHGVSGPAEGLQSQEALRRVGVGGHPDDGLQRLALAGARGEHGPADVGEVFGDQVDEGHLAVADAHGAPDGHVGVGQGPLERADVGGTGEGQTRRFETEDQFAAVERRNRRQILVSVIILVGEGEQRIVPTIHHGHRRTRRPKVHTQSHAS